MKLHESSKLLLPSSKFHSRKKTPKFILLIALIGILTLIPLYFPYSHKKLLLASFIGYHNHGHGGDAAKGGAVMLRPSTNRKTIAESEEEIRSPISARSELRSGNRHKEGHSKPAAAINGGEECDLFTGEWVPNPEGPYYTNATCGEIQEHQNCMKFGRPDTGFMKWRWKPYSCELPIFNPGKFLELMRGKSLGFVGDSIARNHVQSLICLLSKPVDAAEPTDGNRLYLYREFDFNVSIISSPYLVRSEKTDPDDFTRPFDLFLDEFDESWTSKIRSFDYIIISAGQWFLRPTYFYLNRTLAGCLYCPESNVTHLPSSFSYRWAFRTALKAINGVSDFRGVAFVRTMALSHFEGGPWDKGGDCVRTAPLRRNETVLEDYAREMYRIQVEEAGAAGRGTGGRVRVFDVTKAMLVRADGHPSKYGRWPVAYQSFPNDCVHWCLPGPIDAWNDMLQELVRRESHKL